jgi:hypothetical protein
MLTQGGLPESEALHWNATTYKQLGEVVRLLDSQDKNEKVKGRVGYYHLSRMFLQDEWSEYVEKLETMRKEKGFKAIEVLLDEAMHLLIGKGLGTIEALYNKPLEESSMTGKVLSVFSKHLMNLAQELKDLAELKGAAEQVVYTALKEAVEKGAVERAFEAEVPKAEVPKAEVPKAEVPKAEVPKAEVPKAEVPKAEVAEVTFEQCREGMLKLATKDKPAAVAILNKYGAKKLGEVAKEHIAAIHDDFTQALAV